MHVYNTPDGPLLAHDQQHYLINHDWDELINRRNLHLYLLQIQTTSKFISAVQAAQIIRKARAPLGRQEVWAAGVTYLRSRDARMEESKDSGGADFYQKVYEADRPELFFKSLPHRVAAHGEIVNIREDSSWNVPEPELTLFINSFGNIEGYTIGNDMSSRSIEGENPLYLPQAKMYERSTALGPCLFVPKEPISPDTTISITITRKQIQVFSGSILLNRMKRTLPELAGWLFHSCSFPYGCFLMTGTGVVPPDSFTLQSNDVISISIDGIGELSNTVAVLKK